MPSYAEVVNPMYVSYHPRFGQSRAVVHPYSLQIYKKYPVHCCVYDRERHADHGKVFEGYALPLVLLFGMLDDDDVARGAENEQVAGNGASCSQRHEFFYSRVGGSQKREKQCNHGDI